MLSGTEARLALLFMCSVLGCAGRPRAALPDPAAVHASVAGVATAVVSTESAARPMLSTPDGGSASDSISESEIGASGDVGETNSSQAKPTVCPAGMKHIAFDYCPEQSRRCLDKELDKPNHITICKRFAEEKPHCRAPRIPLDFCIDEYEYPNRAGAKPPVMLNFYEASGLCAAEQKRLCYESEWVTACEGPEEKPFPYGYARSSERCNFDNRWVDPHLDRVYAKDPTVQRAELARLDRSVASGDKPSCVSDYGVYDLTGNVDEWALADHDRPREHAKFAALKGGAWGHVRNACRPVTTSHVPEFRYYFIGFRCCADPSR